MRARNIRSLKTEGISAFSRRSGYHDTYEVELKEYIFDAADEFEEGYYTYCIQVRYEGPQQDYASYWYGDVNCFWTYDEIIEESSTLWRLPLPELLGRLTDKNIYEESFYGNDYDKYNLLSTR